MTTKMMLSLFQGCLGPIKLRLIIWQWSMRKSWDYLSWNKRTHGTIMIIIVANVSHFTSLNPHHSHIHTNIDDT